MKRIMEGKKQDSQVIHGSLQKGFGVEHPERIHGYGGFFFCLGDVYASDDVAQMMDHNEEFRDFVIDIIRRLEKSDYGEISWSDKMNNIENRWLAFGAGDQFGRYPYGSAVSSAGTQIPREVLKVRYTRGRTYVMFESEMDETPELK